MNIDIPQENVGAIVVALETRRIYLETWRSDAIGRGKMETANALALDICAIAQMLDAITEARFQQRNPVER